MTNSSFLKRMCSFLLILTAVKPVASNSDTEKYIRYQQPVMFTYEELVELSRNDKLDSQLKSKLDAITTTPFVSNEAYYSGAEPHRPIVDQLGPTLRVVMWNIEQGIQLDTIKLLFTDKDAFLTGVRKSEAKLDAGRLSEQIEVLQTADVLVLNEVDWGMRRSGYRAVVKELGEALKMNWAYGVEFVEVDPISLGTEKLEELKDAQDRMKLIAEIQVDKDRIRALHGTAILSRYPISDVQLEAFTRQGYDWHLGEKERVSAVEKGKRVAAAKVFLEKISREIRRGGRTALIVTLDVPELPEERLTVAATHLENRAKPKIRRAQMHELLILLRDVRNPIIIAGDLNTSKSDSRATSIKREV